MSNIKLTPFQLLELNVISAQDLAQVARKMRTYAVAWVHPDRKLSTRVDVDGQTNPTWNDKFVFRVDDQFLYGDTSAIMIEIFAVHWLRDIHVGTVRVIVGNLIPPTRPYQQQHHQQLQVGMRFVALQVRRPSGRPQGILNIGVALLDSSMRSMPLYSQLSASAVDFYHLMGGGLDPNHHHYNKDDGDGNSDDPIYLLQPPKPPELRRTRSDSSSMMASSMVIAAAKRKMKNAKASSMIDGVEVEKERQQKGKSSKASSMISGSEIVKNGIKFKPGSLVNGSELARALAMVKYGSDVVDGPPDKAPAKSEKIRGGSDNKKPTQAPHKKSTQGTLKKLNYPTIPLMSESDLGPSASEVAAAMAINKRRNKRVVETASEVTGGAWSMDMQGSMEGLQSKLDRWRAELPPVFDRSELSSYEFKKGAIGGRSRRRSAAGCGSFSCFSNICGLECSIVCGGSPPKKNGRRVKRSPSADNLSFV